MQWSKFIVNIASNDLLNRRFENFMVYHNMWCGVTVADEFNMLMMGGEL